MLHLSPGVSLSVDIALISPRSLTTPRGDVRHVVGFFASRGFRARPRTCCSGSLRAWKPSVAACRPSPASGEARMEE
ncbi:MAG: hypothetical protein CBHOC_3045 [uncultured Caballeronia sp.]|nr:MAG: hypothetical protein CBHOC_3045 [uncultured Caballeronia sp.]